MNAVSVVIPTYRASAFIRETLASVFAQTRLPDEVIVADDCSPDDTVAAVEEIAKTAPVPVRVIRLEKNSGGPAKPLNAGIAAARGELIATLDHDDRMTPNRLADQVTAYAACPAVGLVTGRLVCPNSDTSRGTVADRGWQAILQLPATGVAPSVFRVTATDAAAGVLRHGCYVLSCSSLLVPKAVWAEFGGFDERIRTACDFDLLQAVTRKHDLAYTTVVVGEWTAPPTTLFSAASHRQLFADNWTVLDRFARSDLPRELKPLWRRAVSEFLFDHGYTFRKAGELRRAASCHLRAAWTAGVSARGLKELTKIGMASVFPTPRGART